MDCPHIPELSSSAFGKRLDEKISQQRLLLNASIELTHRCNVRCVHCYVAVENNNENATGELTSKEWFSLFDQLADMGTLSLLITGGEPLLRKDFTEIYKYAKRKGFLVTLFTNGTLITEQKADFLAEWWPRLIEITLYGYSQETYERVTRIPGSHAKCMRGIELLLERGIPLKLKAMLMRHNRHELALMKQFSESLGVGFRYDPGINSRLGADRTPLSQRLSPDEIVQYDLESADSNISIQKFLDEVPRAPIDMPYLYSCGAGISGCHIGPDGWLSSCIMARNQGYSLQKGKLSEAWHNFLPTIRFQAAVPDSPCNQCDLIRLCNNCPGWGETDSIPGMPVDFLCELAHCRAEVFDY